ncbi:MAG: hypothetical protein ISR96_07070 [Nitrospira sp.]|nr:hypothetical protein [bacterium]MBL7049256.1 hypothetical protein [Nitrospira sp.]
MEIINDIRFYYYISGVFLNQDKDRLCRECKAFVNTASAIKLALAEIRQGVSADTSSLPADLQKMLDESTARMEGLELSGNSIGQKKTGNCRMPSGACFIKTSKKLLNASQV